MLKEVGASGQISLGKNTQGPQIIQAPDGWVPPGGYEGCTKWALDNRAALEHYARQVEEEGTAAEQLQSYLSEHPEIINGKHVEI